jgi:type VI secretion system protein
MKFDISNRANNDYPLQVDVIVAYDPELVDDLDRLTSAEWFAQRDQRLRNNPGESSFTTWRWEITPGQDVPSVELALPGRPAQGLIFADYLSRGKHSSRFDPGLAQTVQFRHDAFRVTAGDAIEEASRGWRPPVGWTGVGLGVAGLGLGTVFAVLASDASDESKGLKPSQADKHRQLENDIDNYTTGMWISYGVGAAFLIAGATILLWPESNDSPFREVPSSDDSSAGGN